VWTAVGGVYGSTLGRVLMWVVAGVLTADIARNIARFAAAGVRP
jgi:hypothetical protein